MAVSAIDFSSFAGINLSRHARGGWVCQERWSVCRCECESSLGMVTNLVPFGKKMFYWFVIRYWNIGVPKLTQDLNLPPFVQRSVGNPERKRIFQLTV